MNRSMRIQVPPAVPAVRLVPPAPADQQARLRLADHQARYLPSTLAVLPGPLPPLAPESLLVPAGPLAPAILVGRRAHLVLQVPLVQGLLEARQRRLIRRMRPAPGSFWRP